MEIDVNWLAEVVSEVLCAFPIELLSAFQLHVILRAQVKNLRKTGDGFVLPSPENEKVNRSGGFFAALR